MSTARNIIDRALGTSMTSRGSVLVDPDVTEVLEQLNLLIQQLYTLLGMPPELGGSTRGDFFATSSTVTINSASPPALPVAAYRHLFRNAGGSEVHVITRLELTKDIAELPPAIILEANAVLSGGRVGDPVDTDVLTVFYTPRPADMTLVTHFIGATTATDDTTSLWPEEVADPWLIAEMRQYFAIKKGTAMQDELADIAERRQTTAALLAVHVGVDASRLIAIRG